MVWMSLQNGKFFLQLRVLPIAFVSIFDHNCLSLEKHVTLCVTAEPLAEQDFVPSELNSTG